MKKGPFSNPTLRKALRLLRGAYKVASDFYKSSRQMYYKALGVEEPSPKIWKAFLAGVRLVRQRTSFSYNLVFTEAPRYAGRNKRALFKYTFIYLIIWLLEWNLGLCVTYAVMGLLVLCLFLDICVMALRASKGALYLILLRRRDIAKKRRSKFQKLCSSILLNFFIGARRFMSNPLFRISKVQALKQASFLWYLAFLWNLLETLIYMAMAGSRLPVTYTRTRDDMIVFVEAVTHNLSINFNPGEVIGWLVSLTVFLALVTNIWLLRNFDLTPAILGSLGILSPHFIIIPLIQVYKLTIMDMTIAVLWNTEGAASTFWFIQVAWVATYYCVYKHLSELGASSPVEVLHELTQGYSKGTFNDNLIWMAVFLKRVGLTIGIISLLFWCMVAKVVFYCLLAYFF